MDGPLRFVLFKPHLEPADPTYCSWKVTRIKTGMPYFTFSSPESIHAILDYLVERENKTGPVKNESYLFTVDRHQTASKSFVEYFAKLNDICGFGFFGRQRFFKAHGMSCN